MQGARGRAAEPVSITRFRVRHCGEGKAAIQEVKYNGVSTYCFRCGESIWEPREPVLRAPAPEPRQDQPCPPDVGDEWPAHAVAWLAALGFGRYERERLFQCYWNEHFDRIVFPLNNGFWTARAVADPRRGRFAPPDTRVKWLSGLYGRARCVQEYGAMAGNTRVPVVLTEDILSAAKIGLSGAPVVAIPCLGTLPSPAVMARAAEAPMTVWWLDPDDAGIRMARQGNKRLAALGLDTRIMFNRVGDQDPKYLEAEEIRRRLSSMTQP